MEPSTTNSRENQHKNHTPTNDDHHEPLIISCEVTAHQEIKNPSNPSTCVAGEAFLVENAGDEQEKGLENGPAGREKLMSHWKEVSGGGTIVIPERWGQEGLLKDWIDYSTFDALLAPKEAGLAREALVAETRRGCRMSKLRL